MAVQHNDVFIVDGADGVVQLQHTLGHVFRGGTPRFVERVISGDDGFVFVAGSDLFPQPLGAILIFAIGPILILAGAAGVIIRRLAAQCAVQIQNHIHAALFRFGNCPVNVMPSVCTQGFGVLFVFDHVPQNRQAYHIKTKGLQLIPIALLDPVVAEQFDQPLLFVVTKTLGQLGLKRTLVMHPIAALAHHPKFLYQPVAQVGAFQVNLPAAGFHPLGAIGFEHGQPFGIRREAAARRAGR